MSGSSKLSRRGRGQVMTTPDGGLHLKSSHHHHPVAVATVAADSDCDESPEPSPVAPPQPQQQQQMQQQQQRTMMMPPWTPLHETPWKGGLDVEDDESLPSIPDNVPSPYSPPPASLFSGEEFPPKSIRKPKPSQEIRVHQQQQQYANNTTTNTNTSASALTTTALHDLSLNHSHPHHSITSPRYPYPPQLRLYGSVGSRYSPESKEEEHHPYHSYSEPPQLQQERPQVLPSILYLKKDLQESHQSLHLLQQENKALAAECDRFQLEVSQWRQQATQHEALQQHIQHLHNEMEQLRQQNNQEIESIQHAAQQKLNEVSTQLVSSQATNARLEAETQKLHEQVQLKESELGEFKAQIKSQAQLAAQKLKSVQDDHDTQLRALHDQRKSLELEIDRLNAMLCEARQQESKVATTVQAQVDEVQAALKEARDTIQELSDQKVVLESELTENECTWHDEIDRVHTQLAEANDALQKAGTCQQNELKELQETLAEATERENQLLVDKEALQNEIASKINEMQNEIDSLQQTLAQANAEKQALQSSLTQKTEALKESYTKYGTLRSEKEALQKEVYRTRKSLQAQSSTTKSRASSGGPEFSPQQQQDLKDEVDRLQTALRQATAKCSALRGERAALTQELADAKHSHADGTQPNNATAALDETTGGEVDDDDLVPNRLGRIRDAAERAALVKEYRRELSRWKLEHDAELKRLTARHEQDLKDVFEEAKAEASARARETRRRLQNEHETKVAALERRTQAELSRVRTYYYIHAFRMYNSKSIFCLECSVWIHFDKM